MSKNAKPAATKPAEAAAAPAPQSKKKLILAVVAVIAIAAVAGWYFTKGKSDAPHAEEVKVAPPKKPILVALETLTVNLQKESTDQYLQIGITLKFYDAKLEEELKANLPEIRSKILLLLATKKASDLGSAEGKMRLIEEIITLGNGVLGIVNKPAHAAVATPKAAASQVAEAGAEEGHAEAAATATPPVHEAEEKKGIVDVLFTAFIIQ